MLIKLPDPNFLEADRFAVIAMRLQLNRCGFVPLMRRLTDVQRLALQLEVILHEDAVKKYRDICTEISIS